MSSSNSPPGPPRITWQDLLLYPGVLACCLILFVLGWLAGRWTTPRTPRDTPPNAKNIDRPVRTMKGLHESEYDLLVKALREHKEHASPEDARVIDECLRVLRESHKQRSK